MPEFELVREIKNLCRNNQMRDIYFEEICCENPVDYVRGCLSGKDLQISVEHNSEGSITIHAVCDGLIQKYVFTPI